MPASTQSRQSARRDGHGGRRGGGSGTIEVTTREDALEAVESRLARIEDMLGSLDQTLVDAVANAIRGGASTVAGENAVGTRRVAAPLRIADGNGTIEKKETLREAIAAVLRRSRRPMNAAQVYEKMAAREGGAMPSGHTPVATISSMLAVEAAKDDGLCVRTSPGHFVLRRETAEKAA